jgi:hypothetical protein
MKNDLPGLNGFLIMVGAAMFFICGVPGIFAESDTMLKNLAWQAGGIVGALMALVGLHRNNPRPGQDD